MEQNTLWRLEYLSNSYSGWNKKLVKSTCFISSISLCSIVELEFRKSVELDLWNVKTYVLRYHKRVSTILWNPVECDLLFDVFLHHHPVYIFSFYFEGIFLIHLVDIILFCKKGENSENGSFGIPSSHETFTAVIRTDCKLRWY